MLQLLQSLSNNSDNEDEQLPTDINTTNDAESFQTIVERMNTDVNSDCQLRKIVNRGWTNGNLIMKAQYSDSTQGTFKIDTPCATVLLCYCATVLLCYSATVLLCYCATVLLCYRRTLTPLFVES